MSEQNTRAEYGAKIVININTYPIPEMKMLSQYVRFIELYFRQYAVVRTMCIEPWKLKEDFWYRQDYIFLDDIARMTKEDSGLYKPLLTEKACMNRHIFAPLNLDPDVQVQLQEQDIDLHDHAKIWEISQLTHAFLSICCQFNFTPYKVTT